jgi:transcriptional regulator with XRE-family HTH domain
MEKTLTIQEWMSAKGVSKEALAAACEVSVQTIMNWLKRPGRIMINKMITIAKVLDINIMQIKIDA